MLIYCRENEIIETSENLVSQLEQESADGNVGSGVIFKLEDIDYIEFV